MGLVGPWAHPMLISSVLACLIGIDIFILPEPTGRISDWFPDIQSEGYNSKEDQVEATRTALPTQILEQKQHQIPRRVAEIIYLKEEGGGHSHHISIDLSPVTGAEDR